MNSASSTLEQPKASYNYRVRYSLQRLCGWLTQLPLSLLIIALLKWRGRYRIRNLPAIRKRFLELTKSEQPLIICANHLTLIDSVIMIWAFASPLRYLFNYRLLAWNLPAVENTKRRFSWRIITYLGKCILVDRMGDAQHGSDIMDAMQQVLNDGDLVMLFPEGTRTRTGRVDASTVTYGVGKVLQALPGCGVLCVYMRGQSQEHYTDFPKRSEVFDLDMELINPYSDKHGLRGAKERSLQVINKLQEMEARYFEQDVNRNATLNML